MLLVYIYIFFIVIIFIIIIIIIIFITIIITVLIITIIYIYVYTCIYIYICMYNYLYIVFTQPSEVFTAHGFQTPRAASTTPAPDSQPQAWRKASKHWRCLGASQESDMGNGNVNITSGEQVSLNDINVSSNEIWEWISWEWNGNKMIPNLTVLKTTCATLIGICAIEMVMSPLSRDTDIYQLDGDDTHQ